MVAKIKALWAKILGWLGKEKAVVQDYEALAKAKFDNVKAKL